jgi:membrane-associated phospholipid phosphatase
MTYIFIIGVAYSRVYTGRHSFDQCITGLLLGYWCAHIAHCYWKPYIFDSSIKNDIPFEKHYYQA